MKRSILNNIQNSYKRFMCLVMKLNRITLSLPSRQPVNLELKFSSKLTGCLDGKEY